jgi:cellulose synthase/poly-beta-1,6-N-acetylglucosamine synthase-like glycosyltransferase
MRDTYCLFVRSGTNNFHHIPLQDDLVILGRSQRSSDVVINDQRASRTHAKLERKPGTGWVITDLHSANGTSIDHHPLRASHPTLWQSGQVVTIGSTTLTLVQMNGSEQQMNVVYDTSHGRDHNEPEAPIVTKPAVIVEDESALQTWHTLTRHDNGQRSLNYCLVVIPTYNETENITRLLEEIIAQGRQFDVLVVDDNSPDGTGDIVAAIAGETDRVRLLRRAGKLGLGTAYLAGFEYAIEHRYPFVVQMDADFSHQPRYLPALLHLCENLCDVAIGSRKVPDGGTENWSRRRQLISRGGSLYTQVILGLPVQDVTAGFKCFRTEVLKTIDLESIETNGFGFQVEVNYRAYRAGFHICEHPIVFPDRVAGTSKMSLRIFAEAMGKVMNMRLTSLMGGYRLVSDESMTRGQLLERQPRTSYVNMARVKARGKVLPTFEDLVLNKTLSVRIATPLLIIAVLCAIVWATLNITHGEWVFAPESLLTGSVVLLSGLLGLQSLFTLAWMLYSWNDPHAAERNRSPKDYAKATYSFTALVPARHEPEVIAHTIRAVADIEYPEYLKETLVLCRYDDEETITRARETIEQLGRSNVRLVIFGGQPINKPAALNKGLKYASHDVVCVFDAEDEPHSDLYQVVNTVMVRDDADVVQSGVQLMNYRSKWFSALNVLEYFFWFKSGLLFFSRLWQVTPLGGNTVFVKRAYLKRIGGWDEQCLTEDADLGIRLTSIGARLRVVYDEAHATQEETPDTVTSFVKQRTRWNQGFLQVLSKGSWKELPRLRQRLLALYILLTPIFQSVLIVTLPFSIFVALTTKIPVGWAVFTFAPLAFLLLQFLVQVLGLVDFTRAYKLRLPFWYPLFLGLVYYPYQLLLAIAAFRAVFRNIFRQGNWEKTRHINAHRALQTEEAGV